MNRDGLPIPLAVAVAVAAVVGLIALTVVALAIRGAIVIWGRDG